MHVDWLVPALLALLVVITFWIALRRPPVDGSIERQAREMRDEVTRSAQGTRQELGAMLAANQGLLFAQQSETARNQNEQIDAFSRQLAATQQLLTDALGRATLQQVEQARLARESLDATQSAQGLRQTASLRELAESLSNQLQALVRTNDQRMGEMRAAVESKLAAIQLDNEKKLEQIRATVDEKLHATLEQRLGESFRQVAERLEQVHRGIGEMQKLASDVGSLSRVLSNVKTRGTFGEVQLGALLEQVFAPAQYAKNVETVPGTNQRVDYAIRFPGRGADEPVWLPIDCKFPREDYERLIEAHERADAAAVEASARAIETRLRIEARTIREKYLAPPHTTDFAILFVPTEGLYAEALRRPGLFESLQRDHRVTLAGPTTLLAVLTSLKVGFNTLALEQRSNEVRDMLSAVKTEFGKFGHVLANVKRQANTVVNSIGEAETRTRQMARALRGVEAAPELRVQTLLPGSWVDNADPDDDADD
ncbi:MAG: DNA recombination protein RmuC [Pseudomonadota bacterium]|nr:DNA recombination protein RmuC [Pseudomonadota bacterium]